MKSANLEETAKSHCGWDGQPPLNFAVTFSQDSSDGRHDHRYTGGRQLLDKFSLNGRDPLTSIGTQK